jgi:hypothetical protein
VVDEGQSLWLRPFFVLSETDRLARARAMTERAERGLVEAHAGRDARTFNPM